MNDRYLAPDWFTRNVFNRVVRALARLGVSVAGSAELRIPGRASGEIRTTPVNPMSIEGERYLVAPRGTTHWVRNLRAAGGGELRVGRRVETFRAEEIPDDVKVPVLREYLRRWAFEAGKFFDGLQPTSTDEQLRSAAAGFPVFRVHIQPSR